MMKKMGVLLALGLVLLSGCSSGNTVSSAEQTQAADPLAAESQSVDLFAMDTTMTLTAYGSHAADALDAASSEVERLDALFSISSESGDIYALNRDHSVTLHEDTQALLKRALEVSDSTDGIFDCTIEPVMDAWGFTTQNYRVPSADELQQLLTHVDYKQVRQNGSDVSIPADVQVDLGGIAKGYTSDRIMQVFADNGVTSGIVSLGGNVQALGCKPDGSKWRAAVQDPNDEGENFAVVEIADEAVITSGGYQRYFEDNGRTYHHIIDPRTGTPADSGVISSTIISHDGTLADGLSTSLFIMGVDDALDYWRAHSDEFDAILMDKDGTVYVTEGIADRCSLLENRKMQVVH